MRSRRKATICNEINVRVHIPPPTIHYRYLYKGAIISGAYKGILAIRFIFTFLRNFEIYCFCSLSKPQTPLSEEVKNMKGTVKWYNPRKGFGFIVGEDGKDIFIHRTDIPTDVELNEDDSVEYEVEQSERGPKAINVKKL